jgi:hypothetical protein
MRLISFLLLICMATSVQSYSQIQLVEQEYHLLENRLFGTSEYEYMNEDDSDESELPSPRSVLFKSMMVLGWGQIENRQFWKVPIIYGMFVGVGVYAGYLNGQYQDYRAAFYNSNQSEDNDFRFGPTPERLQNINSSQLQSVRDNYRNQRDFMFVVMGLAYGLNILDAYVYAHMRGFDVSDDLSARTVIGPTLIADGRPGISLKVSLQKK